MLYRETNPSESFCAPPPLSALEPGPVPVAITACKDGGMSTLISSRKFLSSTKSSKKKEEGPPYFREYVSCSHRRKRETQKCTTTTMNKRKFPDKLKKSENGTLNAIQSLERRTFPSSECLSIVTETSKRNTQLLYEQSSSEIVGYLIYINTSSGLRIHKVCVAEAFRRQGIASRMVRQVCEIAQKTGKDVDLWVDEARVPARQCYAACGFTQAGEVVVDYYGPGRNGLRMIWICE